MCIRDRAAALLARGTVTLHRVPHITDVSVMWSLLEALGARIRYEDKNTVTIDASNVASYRAPYALVRKLAASFDIVGALLGRFGRAEVPLPGGCVLGTRATDMHEQAFVALGCDCLLYTSVPLKEFGLPFGGSPTADLNTVVPLALLVFCMIQVAAFHKKGAAYLGHVFKPFPLLFPINVLDEILRPVTLAARLFFNIFVGELLFIIVTSIILARIKIGAFNLSFGVAVVPFLIQFFNFFVGRCV